MESLRDELQTFKGRALRWAVMETRLGPGTRRTLVLLLALLGAGTPAAAQVFVQADSASLDIQQGESGALAIELSNPTDRDYVFVGAVTTNLPAQVSLDPRQGDLPARSTLVVNVTLAVDGEAAVGPGELRATFAIVDRVAGTSFDRDIRIAVQVVQDPKFLGLVSSPFPPPLDAGWGLFLVELGFWSLVAAFAAAIGGLFVRRLAAHTSEHTQGEMAQRTQFPTAILVLAIGITGSWRLVELGRGLSIVRSITELIALVLFGLLLYRLAQAGLVFLSERRRLRSAGRPHEVLVPLLSKLVAVVLALFVGIQALRILGLDVSVLLAGGVVVGLVLSLAAQDTLSNLFSGLFIIADQPFREGDEIRLSTGDVCRVDRIGLRSTRLFHFRHEQVMIVPNNSLATERVTNMSYPDSTYRLLIQFEVAYSTNLRPAVDLIRKTAAATPNVLSGPGREAAVWLREFTESGVKLEVRVYIPSSRHRNPVRTALMLAIKETLDEQGIEISVPQTDVRLLDHRHLEGQPPADLP